jgi:hypothetical protein
LRPLAKAKVFRILACVADMAAAQHHFNDENSRKGAFRS